MTFLFAAWPFIMIMNYIHRMSELCALQLRKDRFIVWAYMLALALSLCFQTEEGMGWEPSEWLNGWNNGTFKKHQAANLVRWLFVPELMRWMNRSLSLSLTGLWFGWLLYHLIRLGLARLASASAFIAYLHDLAAQWQLISLFAR